MKLDGEHIRFVLDCMRENTTKIRNIKQYLKAAQQYGICLINDHIIKGPQEAVSGRSHQIIMPCGDEYRRGKNTGGNHAVIFECAYRKEHRAEVTRLSRR
mgnify:CR=1 FL=1